MKLIIRLSGWWKRWEEDLIHEDDDLTWTQIAEASGINESVIYTRRSRILEVDDEVLEEYFDDL